MTTTPIRLSPAFLQLHRFHVVAVVCDETGVCEYETVGMFASPECAARTLMFCIERRIYKQSQLSIADTKDTARIFRMSEIKSLSKSDVWPAVPAIGTASA